MKVNMNVNVELTEEQVLEIVRQALGNAAVTRGGPRTVVGNLPPYDDDPPPPPEPCGMENCQRLGDDRLRCGRASCPHSATNAAARTGVV